MVSILSRSLNLNPLTEEVTYRRRRNKKLSTTRTFRPGVQEEVNLEHFSDIEVEEAPYYYNIFISGNKKAKERIDK